MDERSLGRLEAQVENLTLTVQATNEESSRHREAIRTELSRLNEQIAPINMSLTELGRRVLAQGNILKGYEEKRLMFTGVTRVGKWFGRSVWIVISAIVVVWGEHLKTPFVKLIELFTK